MTMIQRLVGLLIPLLVATSLFAMTAEPASACRCVPPNPAEQYTRAKAVFTGTVSRLEYFYDSPDLDGVVAGPGRGSAPAPVLWQWATFNIVKGFKGAETSTAQVVIGASRMSAATCGFDLSRETEYLVLATMRPDGRLFTSVCTGTAPATEQLLVDFGLGERASSESTMEVAGSARLSAIPAPLATARAQGVSDTAPSSDVGVDPRVLTRGGPVADPPQRMSLPITIVIGALGVAALGTILLVALTRGAHSR